MKEFINELNANMRANGDIWQIRSINHKEMVSIEASKFANMIIDLVLDTELQSKIKETYFAMEAEEQYLQDNMEEDEWFAPSWTNEDRVKEYMKIYKNHCKELEDDDDIPF